MSIQSGGASNPCFLFFNIQAPMQSWGLRARWQYRDSGTEPSKSGIIGMIGAAMGIRRYDPRLEELEESLEMAVRVDQPGVLFQDFQIARGAFPKAKGGFRKEDYSQPMHKTYISDGSFWIVLKGSEELLSEIKAALEDPVWPYFLGRKSCIPSAPIMPMISDRYTGFEEALSNLEWHPIIPLNEPALEYYLKTYRLYRPPVERKKNGKKALKLRCIIEEPRILTGDNADEVHLHSLQRIDRIRANRGYLYEMRFVNETFVYIDIPDWAIDYFSDPSEDEIDNDSDDRSDGNVDNYNADVNRDVSTGG